MKSSRSSTINHHLPCLNHIFPAISMGYPSDSPCAQGAVSQQRPQEALGHFEAAPRRRLRHHDGGLHQEPRHGGVAAACGRWKFVWGGGSGTSEKWRFSWENHGETC